MSQIVNVFIKKPNNSHLSCARIDVAYNMNVLCVKYKYFNPLETIFDFLMCNKERDI